DCDEPVTMEDASIIDTSSPTATTTNTSGISDSITVTVPDVAAAAESSESSSIVDTTSITHSLPILSTTVNVTQSSSSQLSSAPTDIAKDKFDKPVQPEGITFPSLTGFSDWKHGKGKRGTLNIHDFSHKHRAAVLSLKDFQSTNENNTSIANQLERGRKKVIKENRQYVLHLFQVILCCAQQGIPLRGHCEVEHDDSSINVGNFLSFLKLHSRHIELLQSRMTSGPKNATLLSHDYQNSMLSILAKSVLDYIINEMKEAHYFTIMVDETKDISKKEQLTLILRFVLKGVIHERFISYSYCEELNAAALTSYIYDVLTKNGLKIADCVSQCYDGASVMSGSIT
uniref:DUF4371 domain-containing protein n=2 Tax=Amphimedon queenslandica TaxID=400682 RepID=A0A1X7T5A4_AMPQE